MTDTTTATEFVRSHPKLTAALFGLTMLLSQVGGVAASGGSCTG